MDDEESILKVTSKMLEHLDCEVVTSRNGEDAINLFLESKKNNNPFNVLILDMVIKSGMDGIKTASMIFDIDPSAKIIASSGYNNESVFSNYREFGFYDILPKPYNIEILNDKLKKIKCNE